MLDNLPEDILYYIAKKINDINIVDKFRKLSKDLYYLTEKVKFTEIEVEVVFKKYSPVQCKNFNVIVTVNQNQLNNCNLSDVYGIKGIDITCIDILKYCTDLKYLNLIYTKITDYTTLQYCTNIEVICLINTSIEDITVLCQYTKLESLYLSYTMVTDITVLQYCTKLTYLKLPSHINTACLSHFRNLIINKLT